MGITVTLAGLMVICLMDDGTICPRATDKMNTAWVVKAHPAGRYSKPCNWPSNGANKTTLILRFGTGVQMSFGNTKICCRPEFDLAANQPVTECDLSDLVNAKSSITLCPLDGGLEKNLVPAPLNLPKLTSIDPEFRYFDYGILKKEEFVPLAINFPAATITDDDKWPKGSYECTRDEYVDWYRYSRAGKPGTKLTYFSDRLLARYQGVATIELVAGECGQGQILLSLASPGKELEIKFLNQAKELKSTSDPRNPRYHELDYLHWYYRLGRWNGGGYCPTYKQASILRCIDPDDDPNHDCYFCKVGNKDTTFWPVMRP